MKTTDQDMLVQVDLIGKRNCMPVPRVGESEAESLLGFRIALGGELDES